VLSTSTTRLLAALLVSSAAIGVTGCAGDTDRGGEIEPSVGTVIQPIIRGGASGTEHDSVVILTTVMNGARAALCTATLVAPNLIVTARHCVSNVDSTTACAQDGTPVGGSMIHGNRVAANFAVFIGQNGIAPDSNVEANAAARGKTVIVDSATSVCNHDVAFLILDRNLTAPVSPIRMGAPAAGENVAVVGWGINETGALVTARSVRKDIPLIGIGPAPYPNNASWGYGDAEWMTGESACSGDSGAPAFAPSGAIVGISARAGNGEAKDPNNMASTCLGANAHAVYTQLGKFEKLVTFAFEKAGQPIWREGQQDPWHPAPPAASSGSVATNPDGSPTTPSPQQHSAQADLFGEDLPADRTNAPSGETERDSGGCSMSNEPQRDNVAYAGGIVAVAALLIGLRRRFRKEANDEPPPPRDPYESMM